MLHARFHDHRTFGYLKVFTIYGRGGGGGGHLSHVSWNFNTNFHSPFQWRLHMNFGFDWQSQ